MVDASRSFLVRSVCPVFATDLPNDLRSGMFGNRGIGVGTMAVVVVGYFWEPEVLRHGQETTLALSIESPIGREYYDLLKGAVYHQRDVLIDADDKNLIRSITLYSQRDPYR